jgi:hypothetical protein
MFDNLREMSDGGVLFDEAMDDEFDEQLVEPPEGRIFGMTAGQRFVIAMLLMGTVIVMGLACLMVTGRVMPF